MLDAQFPFVDTLVAEVAKAEWQPRFVIWQIRHSAERYRPLAWL
jgi:hypothetical protein